MTFVIPLKELKPVLYRGVFIRFSQNYGGGVKAVIQDKDGKDLSRVSILDLERAAAIPLMQKEVDMLLDDGWHKDPNSQGVFTKYFFYVNGESKSEVYISQEGRFYDLVYFFPGEGPSQVIERFESSDLALKGMKKYVDQHPNG